MFVDYYRILKISYPSSQEEIKKSYRSLSLKWHPDKNPGVDTTKKMQDINAAYFLLKDEEKKRRYDIEYQLFRDLISSVETQETEISNPFEDRTSYNNSTYQQYRNYSFKNKKVQEDIDDATLFAKKLVADFLKHLKQTSKDAAEGAWGEMLPYIIIALILPIIFTLIHSCQ